MGTRDIAPSCVENVDELIERQEKSLAQLDSKRAVVTDLIAKGKVILQNPDKPKFLEANVKRIQDGWEDTKKKAQDRLQLLNETKEAFIGYAEDSETIASDFEKAEEEIKKVKKIFNLEAANADLSKRQEILKNTDDTWVKKCEVLVKEWVLLDNTVTELNSWVAKDKSAEGENQFSLEKMESTLGELKNIFKQKETLVANL